MSLTEIARTAGVSASTVSRVINNRPGIAEATRAQVIKAMDKIGYVPNPVTLRPGPKSKRHNMQKVSSVAFLSFVSYRSQINSPVYAEIIHGVEEELAKTDMNMVFRQADNGHDIFGWVSRRELDGLILFGPHGSLHDWIRINNKTVPVVSILDSTSSCWSDNISYDKPAVAERVIEYIKGRGHREFLEVGSSRHSRQLAELADINGMKITTLTDESDFYITNEQENRPNQIALAEKFEQYLSANELPRVIFLPADAFAVPVYSILMQKGLVAGRDFEVISVNNEASLLDGLNPRPATIDIRSFDMGRTAVQRLIWRKQNPDEPRLTLLLDPLLIEPDINIQQEIQSEIE